MVPRYHDQYLLTRTEYPNFIDWLEKAREQGSEILLHGLRHLTPNDAPRPQGMIERAKARFLTANEGEFQSMPYDRAVESLSQGLEILDGALGFRPEGFVAPAWLESDQTKEALRSSGFSFHEDHLFMYDLKLDRRLFVPAITFTGRSRVRALASVGWAKVMAPILRAPVDIRLALHPVDFEHDDLVVAMGKLIEVISSRRRWITCSELRSSLLDQGKGV